MFAKVSAFRLFGFPANPLTDPSFISLICAYPTSDVQNDSSVSLAPFTAEILHWFARAGKCA